jgi:hydrogenase maturation protease
VDDEKVIVYGYGNPGRQDDGLGPFLAGRLEAENIPGVEVVSNYQLNIEDAYTVAQGKAVIFIDASLDCDESFSFYEITPSMEIRFTTHSMSPQSVLALCNDLFEKDIKAYILSIRGYSWEFTEGLSPEAEKNLEKAHAFLIKEIPRLLSYQDGTFHPAH